MFRRLAWESPSELPSDSEAEQTGRAQRLNRASHASRSDVAKASLAGTAGELSQVFSRALASTGGLAQQPMTGSQGVPSPKAQPMGEAVKQFGALSARGWRARVEQKSTESPRAILSIYRKLLF